MDYFFFSNTYIALEKPLFVKIPNKFEIDPIIKDLK